MPPDLQAVFPSFAAPAEDRLPPGRAYRIAVGSTIVFCLAAILAALLSGELFRPVRQAVEAGTLSASVLTPGLVWVSMGWALTLTRTVLWLFYRPFPAATHDSAPSMTVVIPAYNEGAMVEQSIESVVAARYPGGRLEILVVDDGSTDDTWTYIRRAAERHPGPGRPR